MKWLFTLIVTWSLAGISHAGEIQDAAREGDIGRVRALVYTTPTAVNARDRGTTPLHEAARAGQLAVIKFLVEKGADLNTADISGATPLRLALGYRRTEVADFLRQHGALEKVPATAPKIAPVPTATAVAKVPAAISPAALTSAPPRNTNAAPTQRPASPKPAATNVVAASTNVAANPREMLQVIYPIHEAARIGDVEQIKFLFKSFPDLVEATDEKGMTPLHITAANKQLAAAQALVGFRARISARSDTGQTPLHLAARAGDVKLVQLLLTNHADVNARDSADATPLLAATQSSDKEEFQATDLNEKARFTSAQRRAAAAQMHQEQLAMARQLVAHGADVNARNRAGANALIQAVRLRNEPLVDFLLRSSADPNAVDSTGRVTPLHLASGRGLTNMVAMLLNAKATVNAVDSRGETPLGYALRDNHRAVASLLKQNGGNVGVSRALSTPEQNLVDFYQRTEASLQRASVSDKSRLILEMMATRSDVQKMFPRHAEAAGRVMSCGGRSKAASRSRIPRQARRSGGCARRTRACKHRIGSVEAGSAVTCRCFHWSWIASAAHRARAIIASSINAGCCCRRWTSLPRNSRAPR